MPVAEAVAAITTVAQDLNTPQPQRVWLKELLVDLEEGATTKVVDALCTVAQSAATPESARTWLVGLVNALRAERPDPAPDAEDRFTKGAALPSGLGPRADLYAEVRAERLRQEKAAEAVKARETEIYNSILADLNESTDTGAAGKFYRVQRVEKTVQNVADWPSFWAFIRENNAFEMLQKRLSDKAVAEWAESKDALPPGINQAQIATLSFTKI
jgi:hypothetical protein